MLKPIARVLGMRTARPSIEEAFVGFDAVNARDFGPIGALPSGKARRSKGSTTLIGLRRIRAPAKPIQIFFVRSLSVDLTRPAPSLTLKHHQFGDPLTRSFGMRARAVDV